MTNFSYSTRIALDAFRLAVFEVQKRSLNTYAGWIWSLMNPLAQMGLLYFIMTYVFKSNVENLLLWLISGLTTWIIIQNSILRSCSSFVSRRALIQNNNILPSLLVVADIISEIFILVPFFGIGVFVVFINGIQSLNLLYIPLALFCLMTFLFGVGLVLATITPFLRDIPYLVGLCMQVTFWLTPIAYSKSTMPSYVRLIVQLNPFTYYIEFAQAVFSVNSLVLKVVAIPFAISATTLLIGLFISAKFGKKMVIYL
jgi:lipopolysaccharide transport system permease protein